MDSIKAAETKLDHKLVMGTDESKAKWHLVSKDTLYDYHPELSDDIKTTWKTSMMPNQLLVSHLKMLTVLSSSILK